MKNERPGHALFMQHFLGRFLEVFGSSRHRKSEQNHGRVVHFEGPIKIKQNVWSVDNLYIFGSQNLARVWLDDV